MMTARINFRTPLFVGMFLLAAPAAGEFQPQLIAAAASCESLSGLALTNAHVTSATMVQAGAFLPPGAAGRGNATQQFAALPAFCRVAVTSNPVSDSDIKIEVWLPASGWNGKFQGTGNGGWGGAITYTALAAAIAQGYAGASSDVGHATPGGSFAMNHPEKLRDYAYRGAHEMTVQAKAVINAFYGTPQKASIFSGCSTGGRMGIVEASKYPEDYDAYVVGANSLTFPRIHGARVQFNRMVHRSADSYIPPEKYPAIHEAALQTCDALDGVKDGVIDNPTRCKFDPGVLACKGADGPGCLTPAQVETARQAYGPVKDPKTGKVLLFQLLQPGTELSWATLGGPAAFGISVDAFRYIAFNDPKWEPTSFQATADTELLERKSKEAGFEPPNPDLRPFFSRGGKLLMYHGWGDFQMSPLNSVTFYEAATKIAGASAAQKSIALYMIPGMGHCQGGPGTDTFDKVGALEQFVATGRPPAQILASHLTAGKVDRTRPLCPYPQVAKYKGTGSTDDASNFSCAMP